MEENLKDTNNTEDDLQKDNKQDKTKKASDSESMEKETVQSREDSMIQKNTPGEYDTAKKNLQYCTKAPAPEQAGWHHDDDPCDDGRSGDID